VSKLHLAEARNAILRASLEIRDAAALDALHKALLALEELQARPHALGCADVHEGPECVVRKGYAPALCDAARDTCHALGLPWLDPRTGQTLHPPRTAPGKFLVRCFLGPWRPLPGEEGTGVEIVTRVAAEDAEQAVAAVAFRWGEILKDSPYVLQRATWEET